MNEQNFIEKNRLDELTNLIESGNFKIKSLEIPRFDFDHPFGGIKITVIPSEEENPEEPETE